jgi:hypothetical protein
MKKSWFFKKINNIGKQSICLKGGEKTQINKIRDEEGTITTNTNEIQNHYGIL